MADEGNKCGREICCSGFFLCRSGIAKSVAQENGAERKLTRIIAFDEQRHLRHAEFGPVAQYHSELVRFTRRQVNLRLIPAWKKPRLDASIETLLVGAPFGIIAKHSEQRPFRGATRQVAETRGHASVFSFHDTQHADRSM